MYHGKKQFGQKVMNFFHGILHACMQKKKDFSTLDDASNTKEI